jgi:hypothetical protein
LLDSAAGIAEVDFSSTASAVGAIGSIIGAASGVGSGVTGATVGVSSNVGAGVGVSTGESKTVITPAGVVAPATLRVSISEREKIETTGRTTTAN